MMGGAEEEEEKKGYLPEMQEYQNYGYYDEEDSDVDQDKSTLYMYEIPSYTTVEILTQVIMAKTNFYAIPILTTKEGWHTKAQVVFEDPFQMQEAAKIMRYFEVYDRSGEWSYSLGYGEKVSPKRYDSISEEIVFVTNVP